MRSRAPRVVLVALAAVVLPACNQEYPNPFAGGNTSVRIPAGADILFTSNLHGGDSTREVYAVEDSGANVTRLTTCAPGPAPCDALEAVSAPDRERIAVRRGTVEDTALLLVDLARRVEGGLLAANARVGGIDWSSQDVLVYSASGATGLEDLYRMDPNGADIRNLTGSPGVRERRPKIDPTGTQAAFEHIEGTGRGEIWIFIATNNQVRVTSGGVPGPAMPGTPYFEGADADPDYSPDGGSLVFRRLSRATADRQGEWDILTTRLNGTGERTIATGAAWRGAPDWGPGGIVFVEQQGQQRRLVLVDPDGGNRRELLTVSAAVAVDNPRWLP